MGLPLFLFGTRRVVSSWVIWVAGLSLLRYSPATGSGGIFFSMAWCLELAAFCLWTAAWVDVYPSSLLPISCVSTTS
ncbi:hypothetical protein B0T12DRAFT_216497 [Alternaria alternata]|nr:hypothetical protein B0T12DRAFT_216497 [Alternaria alternata]